METKENRGRMVMCHACKEKFYKDELIQYNKSYRVCKKCNDTTIKEREEYKDLIDYICKGFGLKAPTGQQCKDIKKFKTLGYSYGEIKYTLYYIFCVERKKVEGTSIGLVPYYYEKAKRHFQLVENAKRSAKKIALEERVIVRKSSKKPNVDKTRLINIGEIT